MKPLASPIRNASGGATALCTLPVAILHHRGEKVVVVGDVRSVVINVP